MRWTISQIGELRRIAASGGSYGNAAATLGVSRESVAGAAYRNQIVFRSKRGRPRGPAVGHVPPPHDPGLRGRWTALLPQMKENLRDAVKKYDDDLAYQEKKEFLDGNLPSPTRNNLPRSKHNV